MVVDPSGSLELETPRTAGLGDDGAMVEFDLRLVWDGEDVRSGEANWSPPSADDEDDFASLSITADELVGGAEDRAVLDPRGAGRRLR
ncbi:MAG: hypothetical protein LBO20_05155 [Bifidobacteriaceae bacterium]|nr:hypothetical protein [Bifidobacteriaceae bacterium]